MTAGMPPSSPTIHTHTLTQTQTIFRSVQGRRYFTCGDKYGAFVRPATVTVGDFPEEELDLSSEGEM